MNLESVRERVKEFRPFTLVTSSGNKYPVPHPDFIFFTTRTVVVATQRGDAVIIDPLHIVGLEDIRARKNGRHKRKQTR
ncbi:MAG: hypothetical protein HY298_03645 [Verrucomicrobia bacterium]|nr:hypothetical protein [Verrucomicrobiota bacterium]